MDFQQTLCVHWYCWDLVLDCREWQGIMASRWLCVGLSVRLSILSYPHNNLSKYQWIFAKLGVCIDIVEIWFGLILGKFLQFLTDLSATYQCFHLQMITLVNIKDFYQTWYVHWYWRDLVWNPIADGQISFFWQLSVRDTSIVSFLDDNQ